MRALARFAALVIIISVCSVTTEARVQRAGLNFSWLCIITESSVMRLRCAGVNETSSYDEYPISSTKVVIKSCEPYRMIVRIGWGEHTVIGCFGSRPNDMECGIFINVHAKRFDGLKSKASGGVWRQPVDFTEFMRCRVFKRASGAFAAVVICDPDCDLFLVHGWFGYFSAGRTDPCSLVGDIFRAGDFGLFRSKVGLPLDFRVNFLHFANLLEDSHAGYTKGDQSGDESRYGKIISKSLAAIFASLLLSIGMALIMYGVDQSREIGDGASGYIIFAWAAWMIAALIVIEFIFEIPLAS